SNGVNSVNAFAKRKVLDVSSTPSKVIVSNEPSVPVKTCLYPHELELIKRNAALHGMSVSREIAIRLRKSVLKNEVCLYPEEVQVLRKLSTTINRVGRNIHFIISGDRFCTVNDPDFRNEIKELTALCETVDKTIEQLVFSVNNRFG
ncbi:hypothetical protein MLK28_24240, partial [Escherichia coli]|nr:hypothetical protein [Escherichia coli]